MILIDFGNSRAHVWHDGNIEHMQIDDALRRYRSRKVYYINVNPHNTQLLAALASWHDMDDILHLKGDYVGMGVDRRAICLARDDGILIDAGSAITVDKVTNGTYDGGLIYPGFEAISRAYTSISPVLNQPLETNVVLDTLPRSTLHGVSFGTIAPIVALVEQIRGDWSVWITGGDGELLASHIDNATYDEGLVFEGMMRALGS